MNSNSNENSGMTKKQAIKLVTNMRDIMAELKQTRELLENSTNSLRYKNIELKKLRDNLEFVKSSLKNKNKKLKQQKNELERMKRKESKLKFKILKNKEQKHYDPSINDDVNTFGRTRLYHAVSNNDISEVKRLIKLGADIDKADIYGKTPLHVAMEKGYTDIVDILLM